MIYSDNLVAWKIPAESREKYFELVDKLSSTQTASIDTSNDPVVIFNKEFFYSDGLENN